MACKIFSRIIIEGYFKIFKPVIKLDNIIIILKLYNI